MDLAADGGHADAVAVAADAGHDALEQPAVPLLVERAEPQRVEQRDRPRAHREDVADDPADAGRRALVRLDRARVGVGLDLEDDGEPVADVDHAGVLARPDEDAVALGGQAAQVDLRGLVRAVLGPHRASTSRARCGSGRGRASRRSRAYSSSVSPRARCRGFGHGSPTRSERRVPAATRTAAGRRWARRRGRRRARDAASARPRCPPRCATPAIAFGARRWGCARRRPSPSGAQ